MDVYHFTEYPYIINAYNPQLVISPHLVLEWNGNGVEGEIKNLKFKDPSVEKFLEGCVGKYLIMDAFWVREEILLSDIRFENEQDAIAFKLAYG